MKRIIISVVFLALMATYAYAHQPRIAFGSRHPRENPIIVEKPEISKAYYGELKSEADHYRITSAKPFKLYLGLLAPLQDGARTDTNVDVSAGGKNIIMLKGGSVNWKRFHEEFANDDYLWGPEFERIVGEGTYYIKVYNKDNRGKYSLAVGKVESFPLDETIKTAFTLPSIKSNFFNKPAISAFFNLVGIFLAIELAIVAIIIFAIIFIIRKLLHRFNRSDSLKKGGRK